MAEDFWRSLKRPFADAWYWFRCHTYTRYHIVDCRSKKNGYEWGYNEIDNLILFACFNLLKRFVETQLVPPYDVQKHLASFEDYQKYMGVNFEGRSQEDIEFNLKIMKDQYERELEVKALYDWWTKERAVEHAYARFLMHCIPSKKNEDASIKNGFERYFDAMGGNTPQWKDWREAREANDAKDNEMLLRLMKIRETLWT